MFNGLAGMALAFVLVIILGMILAPLFYYLFGKKEIGAFVGLFIAIIPASFIMEWLSNF